MTSKHKRTIERCLLNLDFVEKNSFTHARFLQEVFPANCLAVVLTNETNNKRQQNSTKLN